MILFRYNSNFLFFLVIYFVITYCSEPELFLSLFVVLVLRNTLKILNTTIFLISNVA